MKKKILIAIVVLIVMFLAGFFYPKDAGSTCGFCPPPPTVQRTEYGCIGFKQDVEPDPGCMDCGINIVCYGIVTGEKKCYTYMNDFDSPPTEVSCT